MKVLLVHPGKQHSFETVKALKDAGVFYKYVTTVYDKEYSLTGSLKKFLKGKNLKKANTRRCSYLNDNEVIQLYEWWGLLVLFLSKFSFLSKLYFHLNISLSNHFAKKAAKIAIKDKVDAIIVYDGISKKGLELIKKTAPQIKTIMDVSISMRPFLKDNFARDMKEYHHDGFYRKEGYLWKKKYEKVIMNELKFVDHFFAPSRIVVESLLYCGVDRNKIDIVPYGVNPDKFSFIQKQYKPNKPLKFIYVGQISYRKGLHHLLKVVKEYKPADIELILAGAFNQTDDLYRQYKDVANISFLGFVTRDILAKAYQDADIFILPSLGEGMAMVILEALSTGTPVLVSNFTGGNDAIENFKNGLVYNGLSEEDLKSSISWYLKHKDAIPEMSKNARESALRYTWEIYHKNYAEKLKLFLSKK